MCGSIFIKIEFWVIFGPEITKIQKNWAKMAFILLDRAKNIWNISINWKNALCSIKSGFSRGVAKRTPPGTQTSKITLVLKGLTNQLFHQSFGARLYLSTWYCNIKNLNFRMPSHEELEKKYENTVSTSASEVFEQVVEFTPKRKRVKILRKVPRMKNRLTSKHGWVNGIQLYINYLVSKFS